MELRHFCHHDHPLVFNEHERQGIHCRGCREPVLGPSYSCIICNNFYHHKSCAELPLVLHHPLHLTHALILFDYEKIYKDDKTYSKCIVCKQFRKEYIYRCSHCNFNLHNKCASLPPTMKVEVHDHPLTRIWKPMNFTCDLCGKEGSVPILCPPCNFAIHPSCASCLRKVKVLRHDHPLDLIHSLEVLQSDSRVCQLCVQNVDTHYGLYYCSRCDFVAHLDCAMYYRNREYINKEFAKSKTMLENEDPELDQSVESTTYEIKKIKNNVGENGIEIATEIEHFSHEHDLKLIDEVQNNEKCNGCIRTIFPPFYSCAKCNFFLHKSCVELPKKKQHILHQHPLTLLSRSNFFQCNSCGDMCNGFMYSCEMCKFYLDVQCSLISDILTHECHKHRLILSIRSYKQRCNGCDNERLRVFRCNTCEFAIGYECATRPYITRYKQHEHPFTLCYTAEDDSGEYYCDICEEERDPKQWFYYYADCSYPAHPECILGIYPKCKFGGVYTFDCHPHPLTFVEETKDHPPCDKCGVPCVELIYQCTQCNFNMHGNECCV